VDDQPATPQGFEWAVEIGLAAGLVGGAVPALNNAYSTNGQYGMNAVQAAVDNFWSQNMAWYGAVNVARAGASAVVSNVDAPADKKKSPPPSQWAY
jgi:hypothetical protein